MDDTEKIGKPAKKHVLQHYRSEYAVQYLVITGHAEQSSGCFGLFRQPPDSGSFDATVLVVIINKFKSL